MGKFLPIPLVLTRDPLQIVPMKVHCPHDKMVPIGEMVPNPKNPNVHSADQIESLANILAYQGWRYPIKVCTQSGFIPSGHGRLLAATKLGLKKVPVSFQDYDSEEQMYADLVSDNAIASWAELKLADINIEIPNLGPDFDIDLLGIKNFKIDVAENEGLTDPDAIPENAETRVKPGDIWILGNHRLMCGDCTVSTNVDALMGADRASVWLSDPPYGINHVEVSNEKGQSKGYDKIENDDLEDQEFQDFIFSCISASLPFMKDGFAFYMWHAMKMQGYTAAAAAAAAGILFHRQIVWVKPQFVFGRGHYHWRHELCLMGWLKGNEPDFFGERNQSTIWECGRENDKIHPTQKPVGLLEPSILNHTKPGDVVYEPFCGSGSTLIACEKTNRKCRALELSPKYCDSILTRWEKFTGKAAVLQK